MDLEQLLGILRRHWRVVAAVLIVTVVGALQVPGHIAPSYEANGNVILLSPSTVDNSDTGDTVEVNPYARFGGAESVAATAIIEVLRSDATAARVEEDEAVESYVVAINQGGNGAIIDLSVRAANPTSTLTAYDMVLDLLVSELEGRQDDSGAPESTWLRAQVLTRPDQATELPGSQTRVMIAVGGLGVVAAIALAIALDSIRLPGRNRKPRRSRRSRTTAPDAGDAQVAPAAVEVPGIALVSAEAIQEREHTP